MHGKQTMIDTWNPAAVGCISRWISHDLLENPTSVGFTHRGASNPRLGKGKGKEGNGKQGADWGGMHRGIHPRRLAAGTWKWWDWEDDFPFLGVLSQVPLLIFWGGAEFFFLLNADILDSGVFRHQLNPSPVGADDWFCCWEFMGWICGLPFLWDFSWRLEACLTHDDCFFGLGTW